ITGAEVASGDRVDQPVRHLSDPRLTRRLPGLASALEIEGMAALGGLSHRAEPLGGRYEVDLLVEDAILVPDADRHDEDAEDVALVRLDPRARLVVVARG